MYDDSNQPLVAVRIKDGIFCGNVTAAYDEDFLVTNKVTHIVNCAGGETRDLFKHNGIAYLNFPWSFPQGGAGSAVSNLFDGSDKNIESVIRFVDETIAQGECVLIQSLHGRSRSCAICAAYFIVKYRWTLDHALDFIAMAHEDMDIMPQFRKQLEIFYQRHEVPPSTTGRALDIFHPEIDDAAFALDNEQWVLRNTYINGLVSEAQEKTDLFKVATARVQLQEPNPKSAAKRRRRITFCDTKQGTSVACMWTQPVIQHRAPSPLIRPPAELGNGNIARNGTPLTHRLEGDANAHVHTASPHLIPASQHSSASAQPIKLQLRSNLQERQKQLQQQQQQQQQGSTAGSSSISSGLLLRHESPHIGSQGPALVAQQQQQGQQGQQSYNNNSNNDSYNNNNNNNNNNAAHRTMVGNLAASSQPQQVYSNNSTSTSSQQYQNQQQQQQQQQPQSQNAPTAANIAASLGTTGQGSLITLRGGQPMSLSVGGGGGSSSSQQQQQQPGQQTGQGQQQRSINVMVPIPDASSTVRSYGNSTSTTTNNNNNNYNNTTSSSSNNNNNNNTSTSSTMPGRQNNASSSTTPARPGPIVTGGAGGAGTSRTSGVLPGHNRNNPFTLPASGKSAHRGSPLPQQRTGIGSAGGAKPSSSSSSTYQPLFPGASQRTNSPIRNSASSYSASGSGSGGYSNSPMKSGAGTNSPRGNSPIRNATSAYSSSGSSSSFQQQQPRNNSPSSRLSTNQANASVRGNSPVRPSSTFGSSSSSSGQRPPSPSRVGNNSSFIGTGGQQNNLWSSSLLSSPSSGLRGPNNNNITSSSSSSGNQQHSYLSSGSSSSSSASRPLAATQQQPRGSSPIVRSNSPSRQPTSIANSLRPNSNIPSANSTISSLNQPVPSRPAVVSQQLGSYNSSSSSLNRTNSPMAATRRTNSPNRVSTSGGAGPSSGYGNYGSSSSFLSSSSAAGAGRNSPRGTPATGGGSLAEQYLYRSGGTSGGGVGTNKTATSTTGRNSPLFRR